MPKYENFSKEELLRFIEKQEQELKQKKYGLVWDAEREPEQVVLDCENNLPVLKRVKGKAIKEPKNNGAEDNILIEGDNYHALTVLNYTHKGKIDVIYIDPPYNRGGDFKYNDRYIDKEDGFKHSLWLNFMEKRLNLAKELLSVNGKIIISIDDAEYSNLKLLCNKIFNEDHVDTMIWRKSGDGRDGKMKNTTTFRKDHEYLIFCFKGENSLNKLKEKPNFQNEYLNPDNDPRGPYKAGSISRKESASNPKHENFYIVKSPSGKLFTRQFDVSKEDFEKFNNDILTNINGKKVSRIYWGKNDDAVPAYKIFINEIRKITPYSVLLAKGTTTEGTKEVSEILNMDCSKMRPKPSSLIATLIQLSSFDDSTILDFFAGTGTTGHAVDLINKIFGGKRKYILCTNNENNICTEVCHPRIEKVIKGYKKNGNGEKVEGLGGNLQYFKTAMVKKSNNKDQVRLNLTKECTEMLCVKENIFNLEMEKEDFKIYSSNKNDKFLGVYYNILDNSFGEFVKEIKKLKGDKIVYMFSADDIIDKNLFKGIKNLTIEAIPQRILDVYKQLVKMNIPVKKELIFLEINKAKTKIFEEKEKNEGARILRIVLEKTIQKIAQNSGLNIYSAKGKEEKISSLNDLLKKEKIINQVEWEETKTYLTIGNHASHGDYAEYSLDQVQNFYKHIQNLLNKFNI